MATIRPRRLDNFYRLIGRWLYSQQKLPESERKPLPVKGADGWLLNAPQDLVEYLQAHECELEVLPE